MTGCRQRPPAAARPPRISIDGAIHRGFRPAGNRPPRPRPQGAARRRRCCAAGARRLVERTRRGSRPRAPTGGRSPEDVDAGWAWSARRSRRFWRGGTSPPRQGRLDAVGNAQPRFQGTNLAAKLTLVQRLRDRAAEVVCTSAQRDLAWLLARPERIVPAPGNPPPQPPRRQPRRPVRASDPRAVRGRRRVHPRSVRCPGSGHVPPGAVGTSGPPPRPLPLRWPTAARPPQEPENPRRTPAHPGRGLVHARGSSSSRPTASPPPVSSARGARDTVRGQGGRSSGSW